MRKAIFVALGSLVAALFLGALPASADHTTDNPSGQCAGGEVDGVLATGTQGTESVSACVAGVGAATGARTGETTGYIVVDGDNDNPLTQISQCLDGHLAIVMGDGGPVYQAGDGEYETEEPVLDENGQPTGDTETVTHDADYPQTPASEYEPEPDPGACGEAPAPPAV